MERPGELADDLTVVHDDVQVVPAVRGWAERLRAEFVPQPASLFANDVARLLQDELGAEHVALWCQDGNDLIVLGAAGLNARTRNSRITPWDPVLQEAGGADIRYDHVAHRPPRASEMPGLRSAEVAILWLPDGTTPVVMATVSGESVPAGVEDAIRRLVPELPWDQTTT